MPFVESTLSQGSPPETRAGAPCLFVALNAEEPRLPSWRHSLDGIDEVELGRGAGRETERAKRRLRLRFADRWMSTEHALLRRQGQSWRLEDRGSKNGLFVNGLAAAEAPLADGDVLEIGHTFLVFRAHQPLLDGPADSPAAISQLTSLSPTLADGWQRLNALGKTLVPILIGGETGTGKELVARAVHQLSARSGPFLAVNCGALPQTLLESELFGYKKGAFSGAVEDRPGLIRAAHGGTLFLDEVGELPAAGQAALLRVLQEGEVLPIGATRAVPVDIRVVAATHRHLESLAEGNQFRADLFARLAGFLFQLPPLRERREDLGLLVSALLDRAGAPAGCQFAHLAARSLFQRRWPRNIRELERCLQAAVALAGERAIEVADLGSGAEPPAPAAPEPLSDRRRRQLLALAEEHHGNVAAMARALGKAREQVSRWCKRYGIDPDQFRR